MLSKFVLNLSVGVGAFVIRLSQIAFFFFSSTHPLRQSERVKAPFQTPATKRMEIHRRNALNSRGNLYTSITL